MATTDIYHITGSTVGRPAIRCLGGDVDDYIAANAHAAARVAIGDATGTYSAWINVADITGTYCILCAGDDSAVEFIELNIEAGLLTARCTDATVVQFVVQADSIEIKPHVWTHVALVQDGTPKLYVNGELIATTNDTATDLSEWYAGCQLLDTFRIGAANKVGNASVTNEFAGGISTVKYWNRALNSREVEVDMEGGAFDDDGTYLQFNMNFKDDYVDHGLGADNGTNTGSGIVLNNNYSEFTSRLGFMTGTPVIADKVAISVSGKEGHALVIQAA